MFKLLKLSADKKIKQQILLNMLLVIIQALCDVAVPVLLVYINQLAQYKFTFDKGLLLFNTLSASGNAWLIGFLIFLVGVITIIVGFIGIKITASLTSRISFSLRNLMYRKIQTFSLADIDKINHSSLIVRMTNDVYNLSNAYLFTFRLLTKSLLMYVGCMIGLCVLVLSPIGTTNNINTYNNNFPVFPKYVIIIIIVLATIVLLVIVSIFGGLAKKDFIATQKNNDILNKDVEQNIIGQRVVKSFGLQELQQKSFEIDTNNLRKSATSASGKIFIIIPSIYLILNVVTVLITWFSSVELISKISSIMTLSSLMITAVVLSLVSLINVIRGVPSAARILMLLNFENSIKFKDKPIELTDNNDIIIKDLSFKYNEEAGYALKNINLHINANEVIGIIGPTASGKTTLVNLISRMYDPTNGDINLSGFNIKDFPKQQLKDMITLCPQIITLFHGTIKSNIIFSKQDATEDELIKAATDAHAIEFINAKPNKFDSVVEQRGSNFSGGQKQRIAIARTLLKKSRYLILDDSTSALDMLTEKNIQKTLLKNEFKQTILMVAQRISAVKNANRIIVMNNGEIIGFDTHINLLRNCKEYYEIAISQMGEKEVEKELLQ